MRHCTLPFLLGLAVFSAAGALRAEQVFVAATENGQGVTIRHGSQCYLLAPEHVIGDPSRITIAGRGRHRSTAEKVQTFGYDLAISQVGGAFAEVCTEELKQAAVAETLQKSGVSYVQTANEDGSVNRRQVLIVDEDPLYLRVRPTTPGDRLFQGLSGSLLILAGVPVGMLMSVDPASGHGTALRYDRLQETVAPFFETRATQAKADGAPSITDHGQAPDVRMSATVRDGAWLVMLRNASVRQIVVDEIRADFSRPISLAREAQSLFGEGKRFPTVRVKSFVKSPASASDDPEDQTLYFDNRLDDGRALTNTCDDMSSNLPCRIPPGGSIQIKQLLAAPKRKDAYNPTRVTGLDIPTGTTFRMCAQYDLERRTCIEGAK